MTRRFHDRYEAGRALATELARVVPERNALVLALPRGGVPVAYEVARALDWPLDVIVVRKVGLPGQPELAMGAVASGARASPTRTCSRCSPIRTAFSSRSRRGSSRKWPPRGVVPRRPPTAVRRRPNVRRDRRWARDRRTMEAAVLALRSLGAARIVAARRWRRVRRAYGFSAPRMRSSASASRCGFSPSGSGTRTSTRPRTPRSNGCCPRAGTSSVARARRARLAQLNRREPT